MAGRKRKGFGRRISTGCFGGKKGGEGLRPIPVFKRIPHCLAGEILKAAVRRRQHKVYEPTRMKKVLQQFTNVFVWARKLCAPAERKGQVVRSSGKRRMRISNLQAPKGGGDIIEKEPVLC